MYAAKNGWHAFINFRHATALILQCSNSVKPGGGLEFFLPVLLAIYLANMNLFFCEQYVFREQLFLQTR